MTFLALASVLLGAAILGLLLARGLLALSKTRATWIAGGVSVVYAVLLFWQPDAQWLANLWILLAGASLGFLLSLLLSSSASVLAFLITAAIVDVFSFSGGLTNSILEAWRSGGSQILRYLAVFLEVAGRESAVIGVGDLFMLTAAYLGFRRATGSEWWPAACLLSGLFGALVVGYFSGGAPGVPFLAGGGLVFVLLDRRRAS